MQTSTSSAPGTTDVSDPSVPTTPTTPTDTETTDTETTDTLFYDPNCDLYIARTFPEDGQNNVYYRTTVDFTFDPPPWGHEHIEVRHNGQPVAGQILYRDDRVSFVPDAPLEPSTTYKALLEACPPSAITFRTGPTGEVVPPEDLVDSTFSIDLASGRWLRPDEDVGLLFAALLEQELLLGVVAADADEVEMIGALSIPGTVEQDVCYQTIDFPVAAFDENPFFSLGPDDTVVDILGYEVPMRNLQITGAFRADLSVLDGVVFRTQVDARDIYRLFLLPDPDALCTLLSDLQLACETCGYNGDPYCITLYVDDLQGLEIPSVLEPRELEDILGDPRCY